MSTLLILLALGYLVSRQKAAPPAPSNGGGLPPVESYLPVHPDTPAPPMQTGDPFYDWERMQEWKEENPEWMYDYPMEA